MRRFAFSFSAVFCFSLFALSGQGHAGGSSATVKGTIQKVTIGEKGGSILVEEAPRGEFGRIVFHLGKDTRIVYSDRRKAKSTDLKVGLRVSVEYSGGIDQSKPPQAAADRIVIELPAKAR